MKVVCINNENAESSIDSFIFVWRGASLHYTEVYLTVGKIYQTETIGANVYWLIDDSNKVRSYGRWRFTTIEDWRQKQLNELGV